MTHHRSRLRHARRHLSLPTTLQNLKQRLPVPPCGRRLLAVAASLMVLSGCATTESLPFPAPPPPRIVPPVTDAGTTTSPNADAYDAAVTGPVTAHVTRADISRLPATQTPPAPPILSAAVVDSTAERIGMAPAGAVAGAVASNVSTTRTAPKPAASPTALNPATTQPLPPALPQSTVIELVGTPDGSVAPTEPTQAAAAEEPGDLWQRIRAGFALSDLDDPRVNDHERWYASRPDYVQRMTHRGSRYLHHVVEEVSKRHMPTELALLPFIESAFNPQAQSVAKASGMWQFIPSTGRDFDLKQNIFRDDRLDVLASTRAALAYLEQLHQMFGDWHLALAAYNWGEGNVRKAIAYNRRRGLPTNYQSLRMPSETRNYVPKLLAVKNIVSHPEQYSLTLPAVDDEAYFVRVPIDRDIDTELAARLAGLTLDEFRALNPSMKKPVILAAGTSRILLPSDNADQFRAALAAHDGPLASWTAWVVPRTMKPADAAREIGMEAADLRELNRIPSRMLVKAGSTLLVPRSDELDRDVSEHLADNAQIMLAPDSSKAKRRVLRVRRADSVASLARRYGVSAADLASWNRLSPGGRVAAGRSLVIYVARSAPSSSAQVKVASKRAKATTKRLASSHKASKRVVASKRARVSARSASRRTASANP